MCVLQPRIVMCNSQLMRAAHTALQFSELPQTLCRFYSKTDSAEWRPQEIYKQQRLRASFPATHCCLFSPLQA